MKQITVSDQIHNELRKMDHRWEGADQVLTKLIRFYKKHHGISSKKGAKSPTLHTKTRNPDDIKVFIRKKYQGKKYYEAVQTSFLENQQPSLGMRSIINTIFNFPQDDKFDDRVDRAEKSLRVVLKNSKHAYKFKETDNGIFRLNIR